MRRRTLLVEPFAGSAALSWRLLGNGSPLVGYQGGKGTQARTIARLLGLYDMPDEVILNDVGPWGRVWATSESQLFGSRFDGESITPTVYDLVDEWWAGTSHPINAPTWEAWLKTKTDEPPRVTRIVDVDRVELAPPDPNFGHARYLYEVLSASPVPDLPPHDVAAFLILQALNFRHKAVQERGGQWVTHGYSRTFGEGVAPTERFGGVRPQLDRLVARLTNAKHTDRIRGRHGCAMALPVVKATDALRVVVLIDPPYSGTEGYGEHDLTREEVIVLADRWLEAGAEVAICEGEPLDLPGWRSVPLCAPTRSKGLSEKGAQGREEWLTLAAPPAQPSLFGATPGVRNAEASHDR